MIDNNCLVNFQQFCIVNQLHHFVRVCFAVFFRYVKKFLCFFFNVPLKKHGDESFESSINFFAPIDAHGQF